MAGKLVQVKSDDQVDIIVDLAKEIYLEHYTKFLKKDFVNNMVNIFQNKKHILDSIKNNEKYYLVFYENVAVGYFSYVLEDDFKMFLSKFYIKNSFRKKGLGRMMFDKLFLIAKKNKIKKIWLLTLRLNPTVEIYKKLGFKIEKNVQTEIEPGLFLDDHLLSLEIE